MVGFFDEREFIDEAVACEDRPLFGVQYHPEVENSEFGAELFQNFLGIIRDCRA